MENDSRLAVELCDARTSPPAVSTHFLRQTKQQTCTLFDALYQMEIVQSESDPLFMKKGQVGVFSVTLGPKDPIYDGDRIELYRPILIDPKLVRRKKANQNKDAELKSKAQIRKNRKDSQE